jgi:hypothetical protein
MGGFFLGDGLDGRLFEVGLGFACGIGWIVAEVVMVLSVISRDIAREFGGLLYEACVS